jgi:hypothetical protein
LLFCTECYLSYWSVGRGFMRFDRKGILQNVVDNV